MSKTNVPYQRQLKSFECIWLRILSVFHYPILLILSSKRPEKRSKNPHYTYRWSNLRAKLPNFDLFLSKSKKFAKQRRFHLNVKYMVKIPMGRRTNNLHHQKITLSVGLRFFFSASSFKRFRKKEITDDWFHICTFWHK